MNGLEGTQVLVVGGTSGIGFATAREAVAAGAAVTVASRSPEKLAAASARLPGLRTIPIDVAENASVEQALAGTGPWDHVVITAGGGQHGPVRDVPLDQAGVSLNVKFWGAYRVASRADLVPGGSITFVSGIYAARPQAGRVLAAVSGAALDAMARALALEFAPSRVNVVAPGAVNTEMWDRLTPDARTAMFERIERTVPVGRVAEPEDIAAIILLCMRNPVITGSTIYADGGHILA